MGQGKRELAGSFCGFQVVNKHMKKGGKGEGASEQAEEV